MKDNKKGPAMQAEPITTRTQSINMKAKKIKTYADLYGPMCEVDLPFEEAFK